MLSHPTANTGSGGFAQEASHEEVRYSQVWEDHAVLQAALKVGPADDVLSLSSAGDNVFALLLGEPRSITAVDLSPAQTALTELKLTALRELPDAAALAAFLGARDCTDRSVTYATLAPQLSATSRAYWGRHRDAVRGGVLRCGMLDRYILGFVERYITPLVAPDAIRALLALADPERQAAIFARHFTVLEPAVREWFGRAALTGRARDASQFAHVGDVDVGASFWRRFTEVATELPARGNFYLEWLLTGRYADLELGPPHLVPANHARLRSLTDRVTLRQAELGAFLRSVPDEAFSAANLSDVFEYLDADTADTLRADVAGRLRPGGRLAYWNLFVERSATGLQAGDLESRQVEADGAFARDRVPFYTAFRLEQRPDQSAAA